jgi:hypothetical protein
MRNVTAFKLQYINPELNVGSKLKEIMSINKDDSPFDSINNILLSLALLETIAVRVLSQNESPQGIMGAFILTK